uniref:C-type lectin domain-containing protein n=1 Tax=Acrobeloides nanus TaxID=290746 RepID=A0A914CPZ1_9BILA
MGFDDAEKFCQGNGTSIKTQGHIAGIKNAFANSYLVGQLKSYNISEAWIGAIAIPYTFGYYDFTIWNDGSFLEYTHFADQDGQGYLLDPSDLTINAKDGSWYARKRASNEGNRPFICQLPKIHK